MISAIGSPAVGPGPDDGAPGSVDESLPDRSKKKKSPIAAATTNDDARGGGGRRRGRRAARASGSGQPPSRSERRPRRARGRPVGARRDETRIVGVRVVREPPRSAEGHSAFIRVDPLGPPASRVIVSAELHGPVRGPRGGGAGGVETSRRGARAPPSAARRAVSVPPRPPRRDRARAPSGRRRACPTSSESPRRARDRDRGLGLGRDRGRGRAPARRRRRRAPRGPPGGRVADVRAGRARGLGVVVSWADSAEEGTIRSGVRPTAAVVRPRHRQRRRDDRRERKAGRR